MGGESKGLKGWLSLDNDFENNYTQLGYRTYDPNIGRFLQVDPMFELSPDLSVYQYCSNSPIIFVDPLGLFEFTKLDVARESELEAKLTSELISLYKKKFQAEFEYFLEYAQWQTTVSNGLSNPLCTYKAPPLPSRSEIDMIDADIRKVENQISQLGLGQNYGNRPPIAFNLSGYYSKNNDNNNYYNLFNVSYKKPNEFLEVLSTVNDYIGLTAGTAETIINNEVILQKYKTLPPILITSSKYLKRIGYGAFISTTIISGYKVVYGEISYIQLFVDFGFGLIGSYPSPYTFIISLIYYSQHESIWNPEYSKHFRTPSQWFPKDNTFFVPKYGN